MGSALASQRIRKDYVGLLNSSEFKEKMEIQFTGDNMYVWRVRFDIQRYEISKELKSDFEQLARKLSCKPESLKLEYEVIFPEAYPINPPFIRVV